MDHIKKHRATLSQQPHSSTLNTKAKRALYAFLITTTLLPLSLYAAYDPHYRDQIQKHDHTSKIVTQKLFTAIKKGDILLTLQAIDEHADINAINEHKETPLTIATYNGRTDLMQILLDHNANINAQDFYNNTALLIATNDNLNQCVHLLLSYKASVTMHNKQGDTALVLATYQNNTNIAHILLKHKANVDAQTTNGITALMLAAQHGYTSIIDLLLVHKANLNITSSKGNTALIKAAYKSQSTIIKKLVLCGADIHITNRAGYTALDLNSEARKIIENSTKRRENLALYLCQHGWKHTIEHFMTLALASIVCKYVDPYPSCQAFLVKELLNSAQYYMQNNPECFLASLCALFAYDDTDKYDPYEF